VSKGKRILPLHLPPPPRTIGYLPLIEGLFLSLFSVRSARLEGRVVLYYLPPSSTPARPKEVVGRLCQYSTQRTPPVFSCEALPLFFPSETPKIGYWRSYGELPVLPFSSFCLADLFPINPLIKMGRRGGSTFPSFSTRLRNRRGGLQFPSRLRSLRVVFGFVFEK